MTETATVNPPEVEELISDGSHVAEGALTKLKNAAKRSAAWIVQAPAAMKATAEIFVGTANERALARTFILCNDNEPDWAGRTQTYKQFVNAAERDAFESFSEAERKTFDTNVRSHMRRTVLEPHIVAYAAAKLGITDEVLLTPDNSKLAKEVRAQYERESVKLTIPDRWRDTPPTGSGPGQGAVETAASKVQAASIAIKELSAVERIGYLHKLATDAILPICEPNAVVPGGRKNAANAVADVRNFLSAAFLILDGQVTGGDLEQAREKLTKHSYQD